MAKKTRTNFANASRTPIFGSQRDLKLARCQTLPVVRYVFAVLFSYGLASFFQMLHLWVCWVDTNDKGSTGGGSVRIKKRKDPAQDLKYRDIDATKKTIVI
jgi:hypothetical protein